MASQDGGSMTGLTSGEAREFHRIFMKSTIAFTGWAFGAHVLVHLWRPWFYNDGSQQVSSLLSNLPFFG
ncbi:MAG: light-harvesting antenna LH1, beta subunit [Rhizobiaceae bacterium]|nr:light-harvesting antenna LH1, beta subunit [Rhizobiaceae bacterium]